MRELILEGFIPFFGMVLAFALVFGLVSVITRARQRRLEIQAELQAKLIEKFGSTTELVAFLQSPAGRDFVSGVQRGNVTLVHERVLAGYRRAIILSFVGAAFIALWIVTGMQGLAWPGILILALGLGFLVATMTTARLSQSTDLTVPPQTRAM